MLEDGFNIVDPKEANCYCRHVPERVGELLKYGGCEVRVNSSQVQWICRVDGSKHCTNHLHHYHSRRHDQLASTNDKSEIDPLQISSKMLAKRFCNYFVTITEVMHRIVL